MKRKPKWIKLSYRQVSSPEFQARAAERRAGYAEGRATYARFEEARDFDDLVNSPSPVWIEGYKQGYANAERGRA